MGNGAEMDAEWTSPGRYISLAQLARYWSMDSRVWGSISGLGPSLLSILGYHTSLPTREVNFFKLAQLAGVLVQGSQLWCIQRETHPFWLFKFLRHLALYPWPKFSYLGTNLMHSDFKKLSAMWSMELRFWGSIPGLGPSLLSILLSSQCILSDKPCLTSEAAFVHKANSNYCNLNRKSFKIWQWLLLLRLK